MYILYLPIEYVYIYIYITEDVGWNFLFDVFQLFIGL